MVNNIFLSHSISFITATSRTMNIKGETDKHHFSWSDLYYKKFKEHCSFKNLDKLAGLNSETYQTWIQHPVPDNYWKSMLPTREDYKNIEMPILSITGHYDGDQRGALMYYQDHMQYGDEERKKHHYLIMGPWNHLGSLFPKRTFGGRDFGEASIIDIMKIQLDWYNWIMKGAKRPAFLKNRVVVYTEGINEWKYFDDMEEVSDRKLTLYLSSDKGQANLSNPGSLKDNNMECILPDEFTYDPLDTSPAEYERTNNTIYHHDESHVNDFLISKTFIEQMGENGVVYLSEPLEQAIEITGKPEFVLWLSMDVPDTDFQVLLYEVCEDGTHIVLSDDVMRARYRRSLEEEQLVNPGEICCYRFRNSQFFSKCINRKSRLRLVFKCINSIYWQKNYNSGGLVSDETDKDAKSAHVKVYHNLKYVSFMELPLCTR